MTIAQQLEQRGRQQGIEQGIEQGIQKGEKRLMKQLITDLLKRGYSAPKIAEITNFSLERINEVATQLHNQSESGEIPMTIAQRLVQIGFEKGYRQGFREGFREGFRQGLAISREHNKKKIMNRLVTYLQKDGYDVAKIAQITGLSLTMVQQFMRQVSD